VNVAFCLSQVSRASQRIRPGAGELHPGSERGAWISRAGRRRS
jgi:hypothetical protein